MKMSGYIVMESSEDFEQGLAIEFGQHLPNGGVLAWRDKGPCTIFPDRATAQKAINRTEHYRIAFGHTSPEKRFCKIVPALFY